MVAIIDARAIARELDEKTKIEADALVAAGKPRPGLAIILAGNDPASEIYFRQKIKKCEKVGVCGFEYRLPKTITQDAVLTLLTQLNADRVVQGILVQVPLPDHIDARVVLGAIDPHKDVDGFHPVNVGRLTAGAGGIQPSTPLAVIKLLETVIDDFVGLDAVVIGKSNIVSKPVAMLLLDRNCTVSVPDLHAENLREIVRNADIIVAAAGAPGLVKGEWVKPGAVVIDVGITRVMGADGEEILLGDVKFDEIQHAKAVTPVPGGVGPLTIAYLLHNTVQAAKLLYQENTGSRRILYHA